MATRETLRLLREVRVREMLPGLRDVAAAAPGDLRRLVDQVWLLRLESGLEDPPAWGLALLRRFRPVLPVGPITLVTRADDVVGVLTDQQTFRVTPYARTMLDLAGPFALGLDGADHTTARQRLEAVLAPIDLAALRAWADETAERLVTERCRDGRLDVVADLAERLPARFAAEYLGVPGPDENTLIGWSKTVFEGIFSNLSGQRSLATEAEVAAAALRAHVDKLVAQARSDAGAGGTTVLHRLVEQERADVRAGVRADVRADLRDPAIRTNLIGLVVGAVPPVSEATARAVDHLLGSGGAFGGARSAAVRGDHEMLWRYVREALRFAPQSPGLVREAATPAALGQPPRRGSTVDDGDIVMASTASAMHDPELVEGPGRFRADRADDAYLHFGTGPHRCLGEHLAPVLITAAAAALFRRRGLRRVPGRLGRLTVEGRWPAHLTVAL
jgi:cytochrome P450